MCVCVCVWSIRLILNITLAKKQFNGGRRFVVGFAGNELLKLKGSPALLARITTSHPKDNTNPKVIIS